MFARLRLNGFIGCNYQQHNIDAGRSSEHVPDEPFVSGDIHEAKAHFAFFQECKTQIDGDASALFFFQTVRMRAGQSFDQRRFAVVDMTGGADDDVPYRIRHAGFEEAIIRPLCMLRKIKKRVKSGCARIYFAEAISSTMACAAARGSSAAMIGLPTTM